MSQLPRPNRTQWTIAIILGAVVVALYFTHIIQSDLWNIGIRGILIFAIIAVLIARSQVHIRRYARISNYYLSAFPMLLALIILLQIYLLEQFTGVKTIDPLFSAGLWFVVLSSMGAIVVLINTNRRINELESRLPSRTNSESHSSPNEISPSSCLRSRLERSLQIGILVVAVVALLIATATMIDTKDQIKELKNLVTTNTKQAEILESTLKEIQHQTIVNAYVNGGQFDVKFQQCGKGEKYDEARNYLGQYLHPIPIMVNGDSVQTIVPFYIFFNFEFYGATKDSNFEKYPFDEIRSGTTEYNPSNPQQFKELMLKPQLEKAEELGYTDVRIDVKYSFRPFSSYKDVDFGQSEDKTKVLAKLRLVDEGKWDVLDIPGEVICR